MNGSTMTQALAVLTFNKIQVQIKASDDNLYIAMINTIDYIESILDFENNIACDNPLLFRVNSSYETVIGCNCSNTQVGYVLDLLAILISDVSKWYYKNGS